MRDDSTSPHLRTARTQAVIRRSWRRLSREDLSVRRSQIAADNALRPCLLQL